VTRAHAKVLAAAGLFIALVYFAGEKKLMLFLLFSFYWFSLN
jgi:hypothetical protein